MIKKWLDLESDEQLDQIKRDSEEKYILIFKYSTNCGISTRIFDRLKTEWKKEEIPEEILDCYFLDLIKYRNLSNRIAKDFEVYHESPQVLIIHKGHSIYDDSHSYITFQEIKKIVSIN
ncbi:bacillithiol system redox-active protein YtxJ [soil metagenome]